MDVMKLVMSKFEVRLNDDTNPSDFYVKLFGPKDSPFEDGIWKIHVTLPAAYPYKSPSIGFCNRIFHPNIDEASGSVCLDVINQTWSPMFDLVNVFNVFLPQLLLYPNPSDPLNPSAASLMNRDKKAYEQKVRDYVRTYASQNFKLRKDDDSDDDDDDTTESENERTNKYKKAKRDSDGTEQKGTPITDTPHNHNHSHETKIDRTCDENDNDNEDVLDELDNENEMSDLDDIPNDDCEDVCDDPVADLEL